MNIQRLVRQAMHSPWRLRLLNMGLNRLIPFNKPHGFRIREIGETHIRTYIPYKRRNLNHIRGLHACSLATLSEFTTGFMLICHFDPARYRIIMKTLEMEYHYQGKMEAYATFEVTGEWLKREVLMPLEAQDKVVVVCEVQIHDREGNHLTTGRVHWQVKDWTKVRTRVTG